MLNTKYTISKSSKLVAIFTFLSITAVSSVWAGNTPPKAAKPEPPSDPTLADRILEIVYDYEPDGRHINFRNEDTRIEEFDDDDIEEFKALITEDPTRLNARDVGLMSPLTRFAYLADRVDGASELVEFIVANFPDALISDSDYTIFGLMRNHPELLMKLLSLNRLIKHFSEPQTVFATLPSRTYRLPNPAHKDYGYANIIYAAAVNQHWELLEFLIRQYPYFKVNSMPSVPSEDNPAVNCAWFAADNARWKLLKLIIETHPEIDLRVVDSEWASEHSALDLIIANKQNDILELLFPDLVRRIQAMFLGDMVGDAAMRIARHFLQEADVAFRDVDEAHLDAFILHCIGTKAYVDQVRDQEEEHFVRASRIIAAATTLTVAPIDRRDTEHFFSPTSPGSIRWAREMIMSQLRLVWQDRDERLYPELTPQLRERITAELVRIPLAEFTAQRVYEAIRKVIKKKKQNVLVLKRKRDQVENDLSQELGDDSDDGQPPIKLARTNATVVQGDEQNDETDLRDLILVPIPDASGFFLPK